MAIHAYDEVYVAGAQNILGHAVDFAILTLNIEPDIFGNAFAVSAVSKQFAAGNVSYISGMNGCELARAVLEETHIAFPVTEDVMYLEKSPEFWAGWALAYFQWETGCSFMDILRAVPLTQVIEMYPLYHEMDLAQFVERMREGMKRAYPQTRLRAHRDICGLSQAELARNSGVPLRQIQLFEQGQRDINKTSLLTAYRLSKALHCGVEDLIEHE